MSILSKLEHVLDQQKQMRALATARVQETALVSYKISVMKIGVRHSEPPPQCMPIDRTFTFPLCRAATLTQQVVPCEIHKTDRTKELHHAFHISATLSLGETSFASGRHLFRLTTGLLAKHDETVFKLHGDYAEDGQWEVQLAFSKTGNITSLTVVHDPENHKRVFDLLIEDAVDKEETELRCAIDRAVKMSKLPVGARHVPHDLAQLHICHWCQSAFIPKKPIVDNNHGADDSNNRFD